MTAIFKIGQDARLKEGRGQGRLVTIQEIHPKAEGQHVQLYTVKCKDNEYPYYFAAVPEEYLEAV